MIPEKLFQQADAYWEKHKKPLLVYTDQKYDYVVNVYAEGPGYEFAVGDIYDPELPTWREYLDLDYIDSPKEAMEEYGITEENIDEEIDLEYMNPLNLPKGIAFEIMIQPIQRIFPVGRRVDSSPILGEIFLGENGGVLGDCTQISASGNLLPTALQYLMDKHECAIKLEFIR